MMKFLPRHSLDDADTNRHCKWFVQEFNYATSSQELEKKFLHFAVSSTWVLKKVLGKIWQSSISYLFVFFFLGLNMEQYEGNVMHLKSK